MIVLVSLQEACQLGKITSVNVSLTHSLVVCYCVVLCTVQ